MRTVEVAGTSWCRTVLSRTLKGSHGHPRFSSPFPADAVSLLLLLLPVSLPLTAAATGTAQHLPMLRELPLLPHLLQFLLTLLPLTLLYAVTAVVAAAAIGTAVCVVVDSAADAVCADIAAACEIDEEYVWYCSLQLFG